MRFHPAPLLLMLAACAPALAAADTLAAVNACKALTGDRERLACYDAAVGRPAGTATQATTAPPTAPAVAAAAPAPAASPASTASSPAPAAATAAAATEPVEVFGLSEQAKREREGVVAMSSITARVANVGQLGDGRQSFTLDNQQTWVQVEAATRVRLRPGDEVTIRRAALGSFLLSKAGSGSMRVRRER